MGHWFLSWSLIQLNICFYSALCDICYIGVCGNQTRWQYNTVIYIDALMQKRYNPIADALESDLFCIKPSMW